MRQFGWATGNKANSVLHFIRNDSEIFMPLCCQKKKGGQPLNSEANLSTGRDLGGVGGVDKEFCTACLACAPQDIVDYLSLICNTKQSEKVEKRISGV